jgi:hypothetical protein
MLPVVKYLEIGNTRTLYQSIRHYIFHSLQEHRMRVLGNRAMRGMFGPKREDVAGEWRRLHNEELHNLYASPNIIGGDEMEEDKTGRDM